MIDRPNKASGAVEADGAASNFIRQDPGGRGRSCRYFNIMGISRKDGKPYFGRYSESFRTIGDESLNSSG